MTSFALFMVCVAGSSTAASVHYELFVIQGTHLVDCIVGLLLP